MLILILLNAHQGLVNFKKEKGMIIFIEIFFYLYIIRLLSSIYLVTFSKYPRMINKDVDVYRLFLRICIILWTGCLLFQIKN